MLVELEVGDTRAHRADEERLDLVRVRVRVRVRIRVRVKG